ncbi:NAD(+)/NADH kinase [Umezawaea sp. Da 62-37]|uniref:NAD(+)/NADH kinase n=1 Tax=Umezawaea sp. Da 62-37 TaxID=3075927 RepID=UPI0028F72DAA|nr:NAD(+)/NADH kinase [Umezawaea sp. Da 62-37]WNV84431.1 NAD(+)/NADH kinase [Umezawaea sp. Da 62-37]
MTEIGAVGLVLHPRRDCAQVIGTMVDWARSRDIELFGVESEVERAKGAVSSIGAEDLAGRVDLLVSLGGDGTMLRAMRLGIPDRTPVLGVNLGKLGFLAEIDPPELNDALCAIDEHRFTTEARSGLRAVTEGKDAIAFNDVALVRVPGNGMTAVRLHVEGHPFVSYSADAVVVATPTGSTAYSFSAGGPIISPRAEGLLITPVAPHSTFNRAVFLSGGEKLALEITGSEVGVEADGQLIGYVGAGTVIDIEVLPAAAQVVRLGRTTFYQRAQRKFGLSGFTTQNEV